MASFATLLRFAADSEGETDTSGSFSTRLRRNFRPRLRTGIWALRLIMAGVLMVFGDIVMWQNPPGHDLPTWIARAVLYLSLASILMDLTVRFQIRDIAGFALIGGAIGLISGALIGRNIYLSLPWSLLLRGMGLQTGAAIYALLFFVAVMQGRTIDPRMIIGAIAVGALWGIWIKWYPVQNPPGWGEVSIETATVYLIGGFIVVGLLFLSIGPRFRVVKEQNLQLEWWEAILVGIPLFISLFTGLLDEKIIPILPFLLVCGLFVLVVGALWLGKGGTEPSYLANITISAPNAATYVVLSIIFLFTGTLTASFVTSADSQIGIGTYYIVIILAVLWLPAAMGVTGIRAYRRE